MQNEDSLPCGPVCLPPGSSPARQGPSLESPSIAVQEEEQCD